MEVLNLLQAKNRCLERFLAISLEFEKEAMEKGLEGLGLFETRRDSTLKAIELFDRKITEAVSLLQPKHKTPELVRKLEALLARKNELIQQILLADQKVIQQIELGKLEVLKDLASSRKSREVLSKFKSGWVTESGEGIDQKL